MSDTFRVIPAGSRLRVGRTGRECQIRAYLDSGSQGAVYEAGMDGASYALKWYHPGIAADPRLRARITRAVDRGAPDARFLWPLAAVEAGAGFGYLMRLRPEACAKFSRLFSPRPAERLVLSLRDRAALGAEIAGAFFSLHAKGLCYQDINFGAIFVDPQRLSVLICDNDNVDVDGQPATVTGTPRFMAPEIVRGQAEPSADSDLHSLAVLLFYLLFFHHPLEDLAASQRRMFAQSDEREVFGDRPAFVFGPDASQAALEAHGLGPQWRLWQVLPTGLRRLFERTFTAGLVTPRARAIETEWTDALRDLRDSCVACSSCGFEEPWQPAEGRACAWCGDPLAPAPRLHVGRARIVLTPGARLYSARLGLGPPAPDDPHVAGVVEGGPAELLVRNLSPSTWRLLSPDGRESAASPDASIPVTVGDVLEFGGAARGIIEG
ncbi:protein kinase domain-containing protein [Caulobacter sp. KR2-114]|uniref:protein kinase domain-containing protein n=1 Tax=Caulobacter sp. KR2-114 TaxID=3400912 RepID=UPI003BFFE9D4